MRKVLAAAAAAAALIGGGAATSSAQAQPVYGSDPLLQPAQVGIYFGAATATAGTTKAGKAPAGTGAASLAPRLGLGRRLGLEQLGRSGRGLVVRGHGHGFHDWRGGDWHGGGQGFDGGTRASMAAARASTAATRASMAAARASVGRPGLPRRWRRPRRWPWRPGRRPPPRLGRRAPASAHGRRRSSQGRTHGLRGAMRLADFDFDLPEDRIALRPAEPARRRAPAGGGPGRTAGRIERARPAGAAAAGDMLVLNDTRVIPARLKGARRRDESRRGRRGDPAPAPLALALDRLHAARQAAGGRRPRSRFGETQRPRLPAGRPWTPR